MIRINFECDTVAQLHSEMVALLAGTAMTAVGATGETKAPRGRKAAAETQPPTALQKPAGNSGGDATSSAGQSSAAGEVTKESLSARVLQLGAKSGPLAVQELFGEFGATKFSELTPDKYVAVNARLDDLLAA